MINISILPLGKSQNYTDELITESFISFSSTTYVLYIVSNILKQWDSILMKFIWNRKKAKIKFRYVKLQKEVGHPYVPNLKAYYQAAHVRNVLVWMTESPHTVERGGNKLWRYTTYSSTKSVRTKNYKITFFLFF